MAWGTPPVFVDGNLLTASQLNTLSGNLNETAPAKATVAGSIFAVSATNVIQQRTPADSFIGTLENTTSLTFVSLTTVGPDLNITTGPLALIIVTSGMRNSTVDQECLAGFSSGGATTFSADDPESVTHTSATVNAQQTASFAVVRAFTPGLQNMRVRYRVTGGTGSFYDRRFTAVPF